MAQIIDGKGLAQKIRKQLSQEVEELVRLGKQPCLAVVLVGDDPASQVYVNNKKRSCQEVGIESKEFLLPATATQEELLQLIDDLNQDNTVDGILVQLPLPKGLDEQEVIARINPAKDVDGFHPVNVGKLYIGLDTFLPCTPAGIMEMLKEINYDISGKKAVVLGRSNIVGKPIAQLLLQYNATVTICHSRTKNIKEECSQADILVAAVGQSQMVKADWIKPGAVVIDVGINRVDGKLVGDVDYDAAFQVAGWITPVPGGVGPMTIAMLLKNTVKAAKTKIGF
ncbi:MAG: bifunctional methylenetetrahydrofolate dehydrogenase/methenyltetrahydrofolate cyclohydrolase FolD [Firmicutes bacterium]|nr:bifunctional methylenetetrahydrofolate dehydrogenase/methenyltetrahydrofolate cyclohydrolase FolD [Bacillota bacterium]